MITLNDIKVLGTVYEIGNGTPNGRGAIYDPRGCSPTILASTGGGQQTYDD